MPRRIQRLLCPAIAETWRDIRESVVHARRERFLYGRKHGEGCQRFDWEEMRGYNARVVAGRRLRVFGDVCGAGALDNVARLQSNLRICKLPIKKGKYRELDRHLYIEIP